MKSGEKVAARLVLITFLLIAGFTIYLESDYQKSSPQLQPSHDVKKPKHPPNQLAKLTLQKGRIPKGMSTNDLPDAESRGATLLTLYYGQCHDLPIPEMHSSKEWPEVLARMQSYLQTSKKEMLRHVILPPKKDWSILASYLVNNAQVPLNPLKYDDINTSPGKAFVSACSQCHSAPSPESHTKKEWPRVVLRMKANMLAADLPAPAQATLLDIIDFLQHHSKIQSE